jgi:hypothetical protein
MYVIYKGTVIYKPITYLENGRSTIFQDILVPFTEEGEYTVCATVTTKGTSNGYGERDFTVLSSEIRKKTFALDGGQTTLYPGVPMFFTLELENPESRTDISVRMSLVDENGMPFAGLSPIIAVTSDQMTFRNANPFYLFEPATFTAIASVTLMQVPQIDLPAMQADSYYRIPDSAITIAVNEEKEYYKGYEGSVDITVTVPAGMIVQNPVLTLTSGSGTLNATPFVSTDTSSSVKEYRYKYKPTTVGSPVVHVEIYEASDVSHINTLKQRDATLNVVDFNPEVRITGTVDGEERFIQVKDPTIRMEITQIPEFFTGTYRFEARLNGNPTKVFPVLTTSASATASFDAAYLYNLTGPDVASVIVNVAAIGNESFQASATKAFDVDYPAISNAYFPDYVTNQIYTAYQECQMVGRFNNIDNALKLLGVDLYLSDGTATKTYNGNLELFDTTVQATASFNDIVFESTVEHSGYFAVYSANCNPRYILATSPVSSFTVANTGSYVDIIYPYEGEEVFVGTTLKPAVRLTNIPNVISVRITILDSTDATIVQNGRTQEATPGYWVLGDIDAKKITTSGNYTVIATVESSILGIRTAENGFAAIDGFIRIDTVTRKTGGTLIFPTEYLEFETSMSFENPYASPTEFASLSHAGSGGNVPVEFIDRVIGTNGELKNYSSRWKIPANTTLEATAYTFTFTAEYGLSTDAKVITFNVLPYVATPTFSKSHGTISVGNQIEGYITYSLPREATATIIPFIGGGVTFENATPNGKTWEYIDNPLLGKGDYRIVLKAIPNTEGTWKVYYATTLEEQTYSEEDTYIVIP